MKNYELNLRDATFDDSSMNVFNDACGGLDPCDSGLEPVAPSVAELVDLFLEYRKRVGRRGSGRADRERQHKKT